MYWEAPSFLESFKSDGSRDTGSDCSFAHAQRNEIRCGLISVETKKCLNTSIITEKLKMVYGMKIKC